MALRSLVPSRWTGRRDAETGGLTPFMQLHHEIDRLFDDMCRGFGSFAPFEARWPAIDMAQTDDKLIVRAELPGMSERDVEVSLADGTLVIKGKHQEESKEKLYSERVTGEFERRIALPFQVQDEGVHASFDNGLLTIELRKSAAVQSKRIPISGAQQKQIAH
jgi:HSP20 family protein